MQPDALGRQAADRMVQGVDPGRRELLVIGDARLGVDLVPALGEARVVELQHDSGLDDLPVFLAHRVGAGVEELLVGLVVFVVDARAAGRRDCGHEAFRDPGRAHRRLQVGDVGPQHIAAGTGERAGAHR